MKNKNKIPLNKYSKISLLWGYFHTPIYQHFSKFKRGLSRRLNHLDHSIISTLEIKSGEKHC
jgi:hypothetical protein